MARIEPGREIRGAPVEGQVTFEVAGLLSTLDFDDDGRDFPVTWPDVSGATGVRVDRASLTFFPLTPDAPGRSLSTLAGSHEGTEVVVTIPGGALPIRSFFLEDLEIFHDGEWRTVRDEGELPGDWRMAVSVPQGGRFSAPAYAAPAINLNPGILPPLLAGASLRGRVLRLPDVEAPRFRIQLLRGSDPDDFRTERFRVESVSARAAPEPVGVEAADASGQSLWRQEGRVVQRATVDLRAALERNLGQAVSSGEGPHTAVTVRADRPGRLRTAGISAGGAVLREVGEKLEVACEGDTRALEIPGPSLDGRRPDVATADVVVRHRGLRLHPLSDPVPDRPGDLAGPVLTGGAPVVRRLPAEALRGEELVRIGLVAVVREACEVSVRVLEVVGKTPTGLLGEARATASVEPLEGFAAARPRIVWLELPDPLPVDRSIAVEAGASGGRLHWVALPDGTPRVRFAVSVADPSGSEVSLGGQTIELTGPKTELLGRHLRPSSFRGGPPVVSTDQFCDVVVTNLILEYAP